MNGTGPYDGPAGIHFTAEELLIIWQYLTRIPTTENGDIRRRIKRYLECHTTRGTAEVSPEV